MAKSQPISEPAGDPVVVLGAGINGVAIARELLLNGLPVWLVDRGDMASGTTAYSSRLIHGGLRYLEYGEFSLVSESLHERRRLLELAPHFVQPLRLYIPVAHRFSGLLQSAWRFFGGKVRHPRPRGYWVVRLGLRFYDWISRRGKLPASRVHRLDEPGAPGLDRRRYRWVCSYSDAQIRFPERFVMSMLHDAQAIATEHQVEFRFLNYHSARREGIQLVIARDGDEYRVKPRLLINATGPWGDRTLGGLALESRRLLGGTKGSHLITFHAGLRGSLGGSGIYTEAADGRPVFLLPFGEATLIGTTDIPFEGDPGDAIADDEEIDYLLRTANQTLQDVELTRGDVDQFYCGVRPLPYRSSSTPAATTRRHGVERNDGSPFPTLSIVGGKLTTCRSLAEEVAATVLEDFGINVTHTSRQRPLPGLVSAEAKQKWIARMEAAGWSNSSLLKSWELLGGLAEEAFAAQPTVEYLADSDLPLPVASWCITNEHCQTLEDAVERRLMLLFAPGLSRRTLQALCELLVVQGKLQAGEIEEAIHKYCRLLKSRFGKKVT